VTIPEDVPMIDAPATVAARRAELHVRDAVHHAQAEAPLDALAGIAELTSARRDIDLATLELVRFCRARGRSWKDIAGALGVTRGAASTRFRSAGVR